jgi:hypothetical protein
LFGNRTSFIIFLYFAPEAHSDHGPIVAADCENIVRSAGSRGGPSDDPNGGRLPCVAWRPIPEADRASPGPGDLGIGTPRGWRLCRAIAPHNVLTVVG